MKSTRKLHQDKLDCDFIYKNFLNEDIIIVPFL